MKTYQSFKKVLISILVLLLVFSFTPSLQQKPWVVPEASQKQKNPLSYSKENITLGKNLYSKHCKSCHGKDGEGDGPKAAELKTSPGDFTTVEFQNQSEGSIFYKSTEGRDDMPNFKKKIASDEDRWLIVMYVKTLKQ